MVSEPRVALHGPGTCRNLGREQQGKETIFGVACVRWIFCTAVAPRVFGALYFTVIAMVESFASDGTRDDSFLRRTRGGAGDESEWDKARVSQNAHAREKKAGKTKLKVCSPSLFVRTNQIGTGRGVTACDLR